VSGDAKIDTPTGLVKTGVEDGTVWVHMLEQAAKFAGREHPHVEGTTRSGQVVCARQHGMLQRE
jgi:hypothetical protein